MKSAIRGKVAELTVSGIRAGSADIEFVIQPDQGERLTLLVLSEPEHEPQVFSAMASLLTAAYFARASVTVEYEPVAGKPPRAIKIRLPRWTT